MTGDKKETMMTNGLAKKRLKEKKKLDTEERDNQH
jgi:hypothetical protein